MRAGGGNSGGASGLKPVSGAGRAWKAWEDWQGKVLSKMQVNSKERKMFLSKIKLFKSPLKTEQSAMAPKSELQLFHLVATSPKKMTQQERLEMSLFESTSALLLKKGKKASNMHYYTGKGLIASDA